MVKYSRGYKFLLREDVSVACAIPISCGIDKYVTLDSGLLTIHAGYAWDGASGPVIDTANSIRATLVHDAVYQLMREMVLPYRYRSYCDDLFHSILLEDGMSWMRAWYWYRAVRIFGSMFVK